MSINELLDEESLDPKKLFDENEYITLVIDREGFSKKENDIADLIEGLLLPEVTREQSEAIFKTLKEKNAQVLLVESIQAADSPDEKAKLTAACWECGLDFVNHFLFFATLACDAHFMLALEAYTVIEYTDATPNTDVLTQALSIVSNSKSPNTTIINDLKALIQERFQA